MKFCFNSFHQPSLSLFGLLALSILILSSAGKPAEISLNLKNGNFDGLKDLNPTLSCVGSNKEGDVEFTYGLDIALNPTKNIKSLPRTIWGKTKSNIGGWMTSIRAEVNAQSLKSINFVATAECEEEDISVKAIGSYGDNNVLVSKIQGTKTYKNETAKTSISITPRYNLELEEGDVVIDYAQDKAKFEIIASKTTQQITLSQELNSVNRIGTTLTNYGDVTFEFEKTLVDGSSVTTSVKPNEYLNVRWKDRGWLTNINLPMDGIMDIKGVNVDIKKQVTF